MNQGILTFGDPAVATARENAQCFNPGFTAWLAQNTAVWQAFEREANKVWSRGRRHYSARTLIEFLRHETALGDSGDDFKINNNTAPDLARLYRITHPTREALFELRSMSGHRRGTGT